MSWTTEITEVSARKVHACVFCGGVIERGQRYLCWTTFEDVPFRCKSHPTCAKLWWQYCRWFGIYSEELPMEWNFRDEVLWPTAHVFASLYLGES